MMFSLNQIVKVKEFAFRNKSGGTGLSSDWDEPFSKTVKVRITKHWYDDEIGERAWAVPLETETELIDYLKRNAKTMTVFVGQFDVCAE